MNKSTTSVSKKSAAKKRTTTTVVSRTHRVLPFGNGWVVKPDHVDKFFTVTTTQRQAIDIAKELAKNDQAVLIVHNKNGTVRSRKSFAKDSVKKS